MKELLSNVLAGGSDEVVLVDDELNIFLTTNGVLEFTQQSEKENIIGENISTVFPFSRHVGKLIESDAEYQLDACDVIESSEGVFRIRDHELGFQLTHVTETGSPTYFVVQSEEIGSEGNDVYTAIYATEVSGNEVVDSYIKHVLNYDVDFIAEIRKPDVVTVVEPDSVSTETTPPLVSGVDNVFELIHPSDESDFVDLTTRVCDKNITDSICVRLEGEDDQWRIFEITARSCTQLPFIDTAMISGRDVTDQYFFEQRRRVINRVLRHDLRNEMNVVLGHAEILEERVDESLQDHAAQVRKKADHLVSLGEEVRSIDKELNRTSRRTRQINMQRVISEVVETIHQTYDSVLFKLSVEKTFVLGNGLIKTAIRHIIENAIEHNNHPEDDISVKVECNAVDDKFVEVVIIDNGPGIPKGEIKVINSGGETQLEHISGLGLWMVKWVMESVNGEVDFDTESVDGTKVTLQLQQSALSPNHNSDSDEDDPDPIGSPNVFGDELGGDSTQSELFEDMGSESRSDSEIQTTTRE